jgi:hypothetical protein
VADVTAPPLRSAKIFRHPAILCSYTILGLKPSIVKLLRSTVYDAYKRNEIPTVEIINRELKEKDMNVNHRTLGRWLRKIGFKFQTINKRSAIMECARIVR